MVKKHGPNKILMNRYLFKTVFAIICKAPRSLEYGFYINRNYLLFSGGSAKKAIFFLNTLWC